MVGRPWQEFFDEIARWRDAGRMVDFWWRDDDAGAPAPALSRLLRLADDAAVPLALAVIPARADPDAFDARAAAVVSVLQHGVDHVDRAGPGEKKTEFPLREALPSALARLALGRARLELLRGVSVFRVLVPPWNRISSALLVDHLAAAGYHGLSTFGPRRTAQARVAIACVNTHVDIIEWHGSRGFVGEAAALAQATRHLQARRNGLADAAEPTGWLTHHALHDNAAWTFLQLLMERTGRQSGVRWLSAEELFGAASRV